MPRLFRGAKGSETVEGDGFTQERAGSPFRSAPAMALCGLLFFRGKQGEKRTKRKREFCSPGGFGLI